MATPATALKENLPSIVIIGRANVGKSTLFNTLIEQNHALVSDISGTTRTNNEGNIVWRGVYARVIDTGGVDTPENELFATEILDQSARALSTASIILFVVDARVGILPQEKELARVIRKKYGNKTPILLIANKVENKKTEMEFLSSEWPTLGLGEPLLISSVNGRGVGDMLDQIHTLFEDGTITPKEHTLEDLSTIRVSLVGKPNVGKSSLFNKLIEEDKAIVSDIAHTTREPYDTIVSYEYEGEQHNITFVDTAGIRRKSKVSGILEREGIGKSIAAIEQSDIILLTLDGSEPVSSQDMQLAGLIEKRSKSVVILINKWDLAEDNTDEYRNQVKEMIVAHFPHLDFAPILFVSGKTGYRIQQIFPLIIKIAQARKTEIGTAALTRFITQITREHRPARGKGTRHPSIVRFKQINTDPPIFEAYIKYRTSLHRSYLNYIERRLRESFNFLGTPIVIKLTKMKRT